MTAIAQLVIYDYLLRKPSDYREWYEVPIGISYDNDLTIIPKEVLTTVLGKKTRKDYYGPLDSSDNDYTKLFSFNTYSYNLDSNGYYCESIDIHQKYLDIENNVEALPVRNLRLNNLQQKIDEIKNRRRTLIEVDIIARGKSFPGLTEPIIDFFKSNQSEIDLYIDVGLPDLHNRIVTAVEPWLDVKLATVTARQYMRSLTANYIAPEKRVDLL